MWVRSAGSAGPRQPERDHRDAEIGIDISGQRSKSVDEIEPNSVEAVITQWAEEVCPVWPGRIERLHWGLPDPATDDPGVAAEAMLARFRTTRDEIQRRLIALAATRPPAGVTIDAPHASDLPAIEALIKQGELPAEVVRDAFPDAYVVARREWRIVGVAALERHGDAGLLRSVAVSPSERGRGTGIALVANRLTHADGACVYLLTTTAAPFFTRFGFVQIRRDEAPEPLQASPELSALCPSSATCMTLRPFAEKPVCTKRTVYGLTGLGHSRLGRPSK